MGMDPAPPPVESCSGRDYGIALLWVLLGLIVYGSGIGLRDVWDPDEPRYAEVAREMRVDGQWLVPHENGRVYGDKPPLFFWTIAGLSYLTGQVDPWTARAPSVLCGSLLLGLTFLFGLRRFGRRAAFFATAVLATNGLYISLATHANIDQMHALLTTAALFLWFDATERERVSAGGTLAAWVLAGLALLTKGVGILLVLLIAGATLIASGRWRERRTVGLNFAGLALALGVAGLWFIPAALSGGEGYWWEILWHQTWERATDPHGHQRPFYYFVLNFPLDVLPWTIFLPGAIAALPANWRGPRGPLVRYLTTWFVIGFLAFSASASKRHIYLLPLCPAWALLTGAWLDAIAGEGGAPARLPLSDRIGLWVLTVAISLVGLVSLTAPAWAGAAASWVDEADVRETLLGLRTAAAVAGVLLLAHGAWVLVALRRGNIVGIVASLTSLAATFTLIAFLWILPGANPIRTARPFAEELKRTVPANAEIANVGTLQEEVVFYSGRYFVELESEKKDRDWKDLAAFLERDGVGWVLVREKEFNKLGDLGARIEEVHRGRAGGDIYVLAREKR